MINPGSIVQNLEEMGFNVAGWDGYHTPEMSALLAVKELL